MTADAARRTLVVPVGPPVGRTMPAGWFALVVAAVVTIAVLAVAGPILLSETTEDWRAYEQAAARLASGGPLYVWSLADPSQEYYLYPPPMAALWGLGLTWQVLLGLKIIALGGIATLVEGPVPWRSVVGALLVGITVLSAPILHDLVLSNVMAFYVGAVALALARPGWLGAAPLGALVAIAAKPAIGPLLLWMALVRPRQFGRTFFAGLLTTTAFVFFLGPGRYVEYLQALPQMVVLATPFTGNVGLASVSRELASAGVVLAYAWTAVAAARLAPASSAVVATSMLLLAQPTIGFNYAGLLLPAIIVLWGIERRFALGAAAVVPVVALVSPVVAAVAIASMGTWAGRRR